MLDTVRAFGERQLTTVDDVGEVRRRYLAWAAATAEALEQTIPSGGGPSFDEVADDLRAALAGTDPAPDATAHRLARSLARLTFGRGFFVEACEHYRAAADRAGDAVEATQDLRHAADAAVIAPWLANVDAIAGDLRDIRRWADVPAEVHRADARQLGAVLAPRSIDAVITSPPYPNEKDYTRTTRLESVLLGFVRDRRELQALKRGLVRSNTRGVYRGDDEMTNYLTVNTPVGVPADQQCGKFVFGDMHLYGGDVQPAATALPDDQFPASCGKELTPEEKALAFLFFDLASCIQDEKVDPKILIR